MSNIDVYIELDKGTTFGGTLHSFVRRAREGSTFHYDAAYRASMNAYPFEPAMPLASGEFAFPHGLPRSFRDASPDRWGRMLIEKGLQQHWSHTNAPIRTITEFDYLLGTSDLTRQGALRFRRSGATEFDAANAHVPKLLSLPLLLAAANKLCSQSKGYTEHDFEALKVLLDAGTGALGGARPKSSVVDLNPDPNLDSQRVTAIGGATSFEAGLTMLQETYEHFGVSENASAKMIAAVHAAISKWKMIALTHGAGKDEIKLFSPVFERAQTALASIL